MEKKGLTFLAVLLFLIIRMWGLGPDISNSDAARWHRRSESFLTALKEGNFSETYQKYHPGVTLMWINSVVKQAAFTYQLKTTGEPKTLENADYYPIIHGVSKGVLVVILTFLLILQIKYISRLFDKKTALIYAFLIAVEPYLIGINRWFHLTSLEVFLVFTSLLALLVWSKEKEKKTLVFSSMLFGLAVLTKTSALILFPVFLYIFIKERRWRDLGIFVLVSIATFFVLFPAMWVQPRQVIQKIASSLFGAVSEDIRTSLISPILVPFYYIIMLAFRLSPITLVLFLFSLWKHKRSKDFNILILLLCIVSYYLVLTLANQKIDRYIISFIPYTLLLIATTRIPKIVFLPSLAFLAYVVTMYCPVFSGYYSPVFGGTKQVLKLGLYDNSGEYFSQAATYLNEKGRDKNVYVPNNVESFSYYYKGNLQREFNEDTDYIVRSLYMNRNEFKENMCPSIDKSFDKDTVRIYVCN
ncbi:ArnT family glycosyltransferase [Patescibacteria group bacterium]